MSEGTEVTEQGVAELAAEAQPTEAPKAGEAIMGDQERSTSPLDALYEEGALEGMPKNLQNWIGMQENGVKAEKGLEYLMKKASEKGLEPLGEDATDEEKEARQKAIRDAKGVPEKAEDYEFTFPEGMEMPEENQALLKEFAHKNGHTPDEVNKMIEFQMGIEAQAKEAQVTQTVEKAYKLFEADGVDFDAVAEGIKDWSSEQGYDFDSLRQSADAIHMAHRLQQLLGEKPHVNGDAIRTGPGDPGEKRYKELLAGETQDSKIFLGQDSSSVGVKKRFQLQQEFQDLARTLKR